MVHEKPGFGLRCVSALAIVLAGCALPPASPSATDDLPPSRALQPFPGEQSEAPGRAAQADRHLLLTRGIPTLRRCYTLSTERVVFKVYFLAGDSRADWDAQVKAIPDTCDGTRSWDGAWYYYTVPDSGNNKLMIAWRNIDSQDFGYVLIKNTPSRWTVGTTGGRLWPLENDETRRFSFQTNGRQILIAVKNPKNEGEWTANDIWVTIRQ